MTTMSAAVDELEAEQRDLDSVLSRLAPDEWLMPTPAAGWDVRDQVSHLADIEEVAHDTATGGPRQLNDEATRFPFPDAYTQHGVERGRAMPPAEVLAWWRRGAERTRAMLRTKDPKERVPWGLGISARTLVTARLMEHWAHGLDIRVAVGEPPGATQRLRSVAFLIVSALPYAFRVAGVEPPADRSLRVDLDFEGDLWTFGTDDATDRITGNVLEFCMVGVRRRPRAETSLTADGPLAELALDHARAFL